MDDKGYPYPLYSLDLLAGDARAPEPRYFLPAEDGRLVISPALRRRGANLSCAALRDAVDLALVHHDVHLRTLGSLGLDEAWADAMRHWSKLLLEEDRRRLDLQARQRLGALQRGADLERAWALRGRLLLAAEMADVAPLLPGREASRCQEPVALRTLGPVVARLQEPALAARLARCGFGAEHVAELAAALRRLSTARDEAAALEPERQEHSDRTVVLRGALLGDLALLCRAAARALPPGTGGALQLGALQRGATGRGFPGAAAVRGAARGHRRAASESP